MKRRKVEDHGALCGKIMDEGIRDWSSCGKLMKAEDYSVLWKIETNYEINVSARNSFYGK